MDLVARCWGLDPPHDRPLASPEDLADYAEHQYELGTAGKFGYFCPDHRPAPGINFLERETRARLDGAECPDCGAIMTRVTTMRDRCPACGSEIVRRGL